MTKKINKILLFLSSATILTAPILATISCSSTSDNQNEENTKPDGDNNGSNENNNNSDKPTTQKPLINVDHYTVRGKIRDGNTMLNLPDPIFQQPFKEFPSKNNGYKSEDYKYRIVDENGQPIVYRISINAINFPQLSGNYYYDNSVALTTNPINYDDASSSEKIFFDVIFAEQQGRYSLVIMPPNGDNFWPNFEYGFAGNSGSSGPAFISSIKSGTFVGLDTNDQAVECCFGFYIDDSNQFTIDPFVNKNTKTGIRFKGDLGEAEKNKDASFTYSIKVAPKQ